ncbi:MAG TPA: MoaD/ThiS family protein [Planctomycetota bacterium]|nr:MoaD/ThiS family protein [Planctomycetota bacterium]
MKVVLPAMLADVLGERVLDVEADTVVGALEAVYARIPVLRHHLCDESGGLRTHVLCVHNGVSTRESGGLGGRVRDGDEIRILQAISGG